MHERVTRDRAPYDQWIPEYLRTTPGNVCDYDVIREQIRELSEVYDIREIAYDRWGATQLSQDLYEEGITVVPIGQGFASMSPPTKELERLVLTKRIRHGGHPVMRWMVDNAVTLTDPAENIKLDKAKSTGRIDGLVALVMAVDRATRNPVSRYEQGGLEAV